MNWFVLLRYFIILSQLEEIEFWSKKNTKQKNVPFLNNVIALASRYTNHS